MDQQLTFDPQLPDLPLVFELDAVARLFEQRWPGPGQVAIRTRRLQDVKYRPAERCVAVYELLVEQPGTPPWPTIGVVAIGPDGPALRLFDADPQLPGLARAADPAEMRARFEPLLGAVESCLTTPVRYKPGARCVFRYDLRGPSGQQTVFGKLLAQGGERLMATVTALHEASQATPALPRIPRPLAYWPDLQVLAQPAVAGGELNERAFDPAEEPAVRERWLRAAGACLAALHTLIGVEGPLRTLDDDLGELEEYVAPMALANPSLAARYAQLATMIADLMPGQPEPAAVASHGTFRTDQFLIEGERLVMIDLDSFCWANPARDLGNFLGYLDWKAIRKPADAAFIEHVGQVFLDGYRATGPSLDQRWLALYRSAAMLKIAGRRFRALTAREWPLVPRLLDTAEATLARIAAEG